MENSLFAKRIVPEKLLVLHLKVDKNQREKVYDLSYLLDEALEKMI